MNQSPESQRAAFGKVIAQAWSDDEFRAKLLSAPHAALKDAGLDLPADLNVTITESKPGEMHLVLPPRPSEGEIDDSLLQTAAGGFCSCCCGDSWTDSSI